MLQNPRKTLGFKKNMVYKIPPGGGGKPYPASGLFDERSHITHAVLVPKTLLPVLYRPLAGYGLPPPRGNFVDHIFLEAQCLARILQHVSPLTMAALSCNSLLHTLPNKIFDN